MMTIRQAKGIAPQAPTLKQGPDLVSGPNVVPPKYSSPQHSDKIIKIAAGQNNLDPIKL